MLRQPDVLCCTPLGLYSCAARSSTHCVCLEGGIRTGLRRIGTNAYLWGPMGSYGGHRHPTIGIRTHMNMGAVAMCVEGASLHIGVYPYTPFDTHSYGDHSYGDYSYGDHSYVGPLAMRVDGAVSGPRRPATRGGLEIQGGVENLLRQAHSFGRPSNQCPRHEGAGPCKGINHGNERLMCERTWGVLIQYYSLGGPNGPGNQGGLARDDGAGPCALGRRCVRGSRGRVCAIIV